MHKAGWRLCAALLCLVMLPLGCLGAEQSSGIVYEIFVGSFADSDGDGVGDLRGIAGKLDYIASLGTEYIWLTPIHPSPSYHHYDVTDYYAVAPEFGTLDDFDDLCAACAERGMGILLDLVVNHTGVDHPWFRSAAQALAAGEDSPYLTWYNFSQAGEGHPVPGAAGWYYEGAFGGHMPDLNLDSDDVRREIAAIMAFWQEHGVKGFRLDATTSYYSQNTAQNVEFLRFITQTAKAAHPDCYVVGEAWTNENTILELYGSGIDSLFDFPASAAEGVLIKAASKGKGENAAAKMAAWNEKIRAVSPTSMDAPFLSNHDQARSRGMMASNVKQMKAAAMLYLLLPGRPFLYYGEEIGMSGSGRDENKRLPMLWSAENAALNCRAPADADQEQRLTEGVDSQENDPDSLLSWYRALGRLRQTMPDITRGVMTALETDNAALCAYTVTAGAATLKILINTSARSKAEIEWHGERVLGCVGTTEEAVRSSGALPAISCVVMQMESN